MKTATDAGEQLIGQNVEDGFAVHQTTNNTITIITAIWKKFRTLRRMYVCTRSASGTQVFRMNNAE